MYETQNTHKTKRLTALAPRKLYFPTIKENGANKDCHLSANRHFRKKNNELPINEK